jgi:tetratricopeptide (TPR) repeat protein
VNLLNLLGLCACMLQEFAEAVAHFTAATQAAPHEPRLQQNLALAHELAGNPHRADPHWNRFFDLLDAHQADGRRGETGDDRTRDQIFAGLSRLADLCADREDYPKALSYLQRAARIRPDDFAICERLFQLGVQARRPEDARRALAQLRRLRPREPQLDLYELDLHEVKTLADLERQLAEIQRIRERHPGDPRVEERAVKMVADVVPLMSGQCEQLSEQLGRVVQQVRNLPNYNVNWSAVRDVMRDLLREFQRLRRITGKCLPLVVAEDQRRTIRDLADRIDRKIEACRSLGG